MSNSKEVAELIELANTGHPGVKSTPFFGFGIPCRQGMSTTIVLPDLLDSGMVKHQVLMGKSRYGMSPFAGMPVAGKNKRPMSGLLGSLIRRI